MRLSGKTKLMGLLGSPVSHSISPAMHNKAFEILDLDYAYLAFDIGVDDLENAVEAMKLLRVRGFNLTMPNKNLVCKYVDKLSPLSRIIGACNTVTNDDGILTGTTTDGAGYMKAAKDAGFDLTGKKMTLLGAGGAALAILAQAAFDGLSEISVFNIRDAFFEKAEKIVADLNNETKCKVNLYDLEDENVLNREITDSYILTNATSVGMAPNTDNCIIKDDSIFNSELIVSDVIYNPKETKLLKMAKNKGCRTFNGMYMLLYQGAESFKIWTGEEMPVKEIKELYFSQE
ncbi:shikimate dehydrogenase [Acetitomaculum ruminis DSM 5522]|uniref:Shikimate dehydrogenase (NADP(+)) n=1 Tax=Acetitomaculum ruminis DSM 5522 TaxID=1120918 RepID=A0A1I1A3K3_9FIRM|nr:shikimate dehydrogenase [Acetitomaculum ruminis]SFB32604.1 shikimate dehydrogenase [Acetitomaculum ruminis DSM 5522]